MPSENARGIFRFSRYKIEMCQFNKTIGGDMKRIVIVVFVLLSAAGLKVAQYSHAQKNLLYAQKAYQNQNRFEITIQGTLKVVRNKKGEIIFGTDKSPNEGYSIAYQQLNNKTKMPVGKPAVFFAAGDHFSKEQLKCEECERFWKRTQNQAVATATDGILRVNSDFYYSEKEGKLRIVRTVENISTQPVQLIAIRTQYDARLGSDKQTVFGEVRSHKAKQVTSSFNTDNSIITGFLSSPSLLLLPPCQPCPPDCDLPLTASQGEKELICVDCPKDGSSILNYQAISIPNGQYPQNEIDRQKEKGGCQHSVIVDVWNGTIFNDGKLIKLAEGEIICVDCPKDEASNLIVQPVANSTGAGSIKQNLRNSGLCQLAVNAEKRGSAFSGQSIAKNSSNKKNGQLAPGEQQQFIVTLDTERE